MTYVTIKQRCLPVKQTWENVLFDTVNCNFLNQRSLSTGTVTRKYETVDQKYLNAINIDKMINSLKRFNADNEKLFNADRNELYKHFTIPKKSGGRRPIDAPCPELQKQLRRLANMLINEFGLLYHTSAFAYIKNRNIVDCIAKHQRNESMWFLKTDFSGFFPSTTLEFTMNMVQKVFPLSEICKSQEGYDALKRALSLGFLNNQLPQGTALSPVLTNIIMIPIDCELFNKLAKRKIVYTRYADDMHISAKEKFPYWDVVKTVRETLKEFNAPYLLKDEKTHFGSRKGRNWNLGLMLNADNNITVGYRSKKVFKAMLNNLILDTKNGKYWNNHDVYHLVGLMSYYEMIEKDYFDGIVKKLNEKWNTNMKEILSRYYI